MQYPLISTKAARFTESVIRGMSIEAKKYDAVNLAQGMPDFPAPQILKDAACRAIQDDVNQYAITWGAHDLRHAIADHAGWHLGLTVDPETEITVTCGSTEAMLVTLISLINPGDEVILSQPFYENYWPDCVLAGATPRFVPVRPPHWKFDPDELAAAFNDRTKAIVLCNPNNPTGAVFTREDLEPIAALCRKWDVVAITDEIYEHILFDGREHVALASLDGMHERSVTVGGMSKTYSVTGWRVGTILANPTLTKTFRQIHDFVSIGAAAPLQEAGAVAYRLPRAYYDHLASDYQARRDRFCKVLWEVGFEFDAPEGAYYIMAGIGPFGAVDDVEFARRLVREIGVATVPGSSFFQDKELGRAYTRFCFCKRDATLDAAAERLRALRVIV
ncbi:MAG: aminotransferase class I/II-fold pyridoxal phosphate-dependent enzyme [Paludisphaera borealis]|uniref:pyridoxal phosphate-dependent aminotransferase n=1 Tax=Paludisphaera borealis TaxID=1387353 RepID=UPI00284AF106|nr:aminotransferase class I/II-fold pyridoxal phosphate-dependent enzyme [Paludisphaera borealis]MDR3620089.1 aminotransferase class I/II-fold pyridoxal phosphate-dependent enzyme [Paludisphaera borealis]